MILCVIPMSDTDSVDLDLSTNNIKTSNICRFVGNEECINVVISRLNEARCM